MSRQKRNPEEEILHLKKKLRKLESQTPGTTITITGEYEDRDASALRSEISARRVSENDLFNTTENPICITPPTSSQEPYRWEANSSSSNARANMNAMEENSSRSDPRVNFNAIETNRISGTNISRRERSANSNAVKVNGSKSEPRTSLNATDVNTSRNDHRGNINTMEANISSNELSSCLNTMEADREPRPNLNYVEVNISEPRANLSGNNSSRRESSANLNAVDVNGSRSEPQASLNVTEVNSSKNDHRENMDTMEANISRRARARLNTMETNISAREPRPSLSVVEANSLNNSQTRLTATSETKIPKKNLGRPRTSLNTPQANNTKNKSRTSSETSQTDETDNHSVSDRKEALLKALGDDLSLSGEVIHPNLAQKWVTILRKGLQDDIKEKLCKEYAVPENCKDLKAPSLNEEVSAVIDFQASNRDRILEGKQNQLGLGITAIGRAITVLLNQGENYEVNAMRHFNHGCRILLDLHYVETNSRRHLFKKDLSRSDVFRNLRMQDLERDETLYGNKLTKMIKKQGIPMTPIHRTFSRYGDSPGPSRARNDANLAIDEKTPRYRHN